MITESEVVPRGSKNNNIYHDEGNRNSKKGNSR